MILKKLTINNFQCFFGTNEILFHEGLNLLIGHGGKGKSKLFNSFNWLLFGRIYITDFGWAISDMLPGSANYLMKKHEIINKRALYLANPGEKVECTVILEIEDDKKINYEIERKIEATRKDNEDWDSPNSWDVPSSELKVRYEGRRGTDTKYGEMAISIIEDLFPRGIRNYIWFQGESLDELINFKKEQNLKDAVKHISYYPFYEKLTDIIDLSLEKISKKEIKHKKEVNAKDSEISSLIRRVDFLTNKLSKEIDSKNKISEQIDKVQLALIDDEKQVRGIAGYTELAQKYSKCEMEIKSITDQLTNIDNYQRELLRNLWVLRGADELIKESQKIISGYVEEVYTVPQKKFLDNPSKEKLEQILNHDHQCYVCGAKVDDQHPERVEWIENRLKMQEEFLKEMESYKENMEASARFNIFVGQIHDYPSNLIISLGEIDKQYQESESESEKLMARRKILHATRDKYDEEIDSIKTKYGVDPRKEADKVGLLDKNISVSKRTIRRLEEDLKTADQVIENLQRDLKSAEYELKKYGDQTGKVKDVPETEWKLITMFLDSICKDVKLEAREELLKELIHRSNDFYNRSTNHEVGYKGKVEINKDFILLFDPLINTSHHVRKKMSIINALLTLNQEKMGIFYPFISDAPTSDFDKPSTYAYLMGIKDIFKQSIVITKDIEIGSEEYNNLVSEKKVSKVYQLLSHVYSDDAGSLEANEVSTDFKTLK